MDRFIRINAMTAKDLLAGADYRSDQRARECTPNLYKFDEERGILLFATRCAKSRNAWSQKVQLVDWDIVQDLLEESEEDEFLEETELEEEVELGESEKDEIVEAEEPIETDEQETEEENVKIEPDVEGESERQASIKRCARTWDEIKSILPEVLEIDLKVDCNCPAQRYIYRYITDQLDSSLVPEGRHPGVTNDSLEGVCCKHLLAILKRFFT